MSLSAEFRLWRFPFLASLVPLGWLLFWLIRYHVDVPYAFQWSLISLIEKSHSGSLAIANFWQQQALHRGVFPLLGTLALARLTGWNLCYEAAANVLIAGGILWALTRCLVWSIRQMGDVRMRWLLPLFAVGVFSTVQWENWLTGSGFYTLLCVLASVWALVLLSQNPLIPRRLAGAVILSGVATYSFGFGVGCWPAGWFILRHRALTDPAHREFVRIWWAAALGIVGLYLWDLKWIGVRPLADVLERPWTYFLFIARFLGSPLTGNLIGSVVAGWLGLVGFLLALMQFRTLPADRRVWLVPWIALSIYAVLGAALAALARANPGIGMVSRYTSASSLLWFSHLVFLWGFLKEGALPRWGGVPMLSLLMLGWVVHDVNAANRFRWWHDRMAPAREALRESRQDEELLHRLHPDYLPQVKKAIPILKRYHLSIFREPV